MEEGEREYEKRKTTQRKPTYKAKETRERKQIRE